MIHAATVLCASVLVAAHDQAAPADTHGRLSDALPPETLVCVEGAGLSDLFEQGLGHPLVERFLASELGRAAVANMDAAPDAIVAFVEGLVGRPLFETASDLVSEGVVLGVEWLQGQPSLTLLARSDDSLLWAEILELLLQLSASSGDLPAALVAPVAGPGDADVWRLGDKLSLAHLDGTFVASSPSAGFDDTLRLLVSGAGTGPAASSGFEAARSGASADALLWAWLDMAGLRALDDGKLDGLYAMADQPGIQMVLGPGIALIGRAQEWTSELVLGDSSVALSLTGLGIDPGATRALLPARGDDAQQLVMPTPTPNEVARLVAYRDLAASFAQRSELYPAEVLPAFSKASNDLGPILGGLDLGEEVLPGLSPWVRAVVREVEFDPAATPELPLPAVVLLVDLREPDELGPLLMSAFQTGVGIVNIERGQQGLKPMLLFLENHAGLELTGARFLSPSPEDGVDAIYNLVPACAQVGDTFLLGTHVALVREVAEQLRAGDTLEVAAGRDQLHISAPALQRVLRANYDAIVMNAVLEEGKGMQQARSDTDVLLGLTRFLGSADFSVHYRADDSVQLTLELEFAE